MLKAFCIFSEEQKSLYFLWCEVPDCRAIYDIQLEDRVVNWS